jgi:hypothetical protein
MAAVKSIEWPQKCRKLEHVVWAFWSVTFLKKGEERIAED